MKKYYLILLTLFIGMHTSVFAQLIKTQSVAINFSSVLDLSITSGQNPSANFNTTTLIDNGITKLNATIFKYSSNQAFHVSIAAASANFSGSSPTTMPASVVGYRLNGNTGSYTPLSTTPASLDGTSSATITRGTNTIGVDFFINPGYIYAPATDYTLTINYTISNP